VKPHSGASLTIITNDTTKAKARVYKTFKVHALLTIVKIFFSTSH
jgi:hypothetical protein